MSSARCAAHPSRPAVDACPVCDRPRCAADRTAYEGCVVCHEEDVSGVRSASQDLERLVRAALAAYGAAVAWGYVTSEYVGAEVFQYLSPAVLGVLAGGAATAAAGHPGPGVLSNRIRWVVGLCALLGTALGFVLEGTYGALSSSLDVLVPYVIAVAAGWLWAAPPKAPRAG